MSPNHESQFPTASSSSSFALPISYFYITFNCITTIYRAYVNNDMPMVAFIVFVFLGYFVLDYCLANYRRLPESPMKEFLKITIWALSSAIFFGFCYQFSTFTSLVAVVTMYGFAIVGSVFLFYFYFLHENDQKGCVSLEILLCSCDRRGLGDKNKTGGLENV
ncbi:hypothetical protein MANES_17G020900v8 [Manihot esculenta]|uniref:Uncharacterized protein n=1 Tax=Manihot esculenta TaxID=3983 RepID=A0A2C9U4Z7_MANES|nr:hypothetical protein MANES_17G020900v8 [Manihot esculenta]